MGIVHATTSRIRRKLAGLGGFWKVKRLIGSTVGPVSSLKPLLRSFTEEEWFWVNTEGRRQFPQLRALLPGLPDEQIQSGFTGATGDVTLREGFNAYQLFKRLFEGNVGTFEGRRTILDFGCGWGRIIRFFLKDVEGENLWGIDCFPEMIQLCEETNKFSRFKLIDPRPMTPFDGDTFDMIYCYSVFSHLSEDIHREWLDEFARILKPGGLLVATTQPREFIESVRGFTGRPEEAVDVAPTNDGYGLPGSRPIAERLRRRQILPPGDGGGRSPGRFVLWRDLHSEGLRLGPLDEELHLRGLHHRPSVVTAERDRRRQAAEDEIEFRGHHS